MMLITSVELQAWGTEFVLDCLDDPLTRREFRLIFRGCREIRWSLDSTETTRQTEADVIGFSLGHGEYAEPAILTTDLIEVSVLYDRIEVQDSATANAQDSNERVLIKG